MKVLQIINSLSTGGAEKLMVDMLQKFVEEEIQVDLLLLKKVNSPFTKQVEKLENINVYYTFEKLSFYNPVHVLKIMKYLKNYDIVNVHLFPALYWTSLAKWISRSKTPIILTEHSTNNTRRSNVILKLIDRLVYKSFNTIVAISEIAKTKLSYHLGINYDNLITINNGINLTQIEEANPYSKEELGFKDNDFILIQVSSFRYPKDQKTVIKSLKGVDQNIHLILVGDGHLIHECHRLTEELSLNNRVHFLGLRNDVPELIKSSDLVILSSHYEGLSLSSIEGMYSGKPFLATNVPGLREVVNEAGVLFEYGDYTDLASKIIQLKNDSDLYNKIVKSCIKRAKKFDVNNMIEEYINLYKKSINN